MNVWGINNSKVKKDSEPFFTEGLKLKEISNPHGNKQGLGLGFKSVHSEVEIYLTKSDIKKLVEGLIEMGALNFNKVTIDIPTHRSIKLD